MITLTKLNGKMFVLNAWHIENVEETPDTVITLTTGKKFLVKEKLNEVVKKTKAFYRETTLLHAIPYEKGDQQDER